VSRAQFAFFLSSSFSSVPFSLSVSLSGYEFVGDVDVPSIPLYTQRTLRAPSEHPQNTRRGPSTVVFYENTMPSFHLTAHAENLRSVWFTCLSNR
jgi:hypothetical protein